MGIFMVRKGYCVPIKRKLMSYGDFTEDTVETVPDAGACTKDTIETAPDLSAHTENTTDMAPDTGVPPTDIAQDAGVHPTVTADSHQTLSMETAHGTTHTWN